MIGLRLAITTEGETQTLNITPRTAVAFERHFKTGLAKAFSQEQRLEHLYWLGWETLRSSGTVVKPFDAWLESVEKVEFVNENIGPFEG